MVSISLVFTSSSIAHHATDAHFEEVVYMTNETKMQVTVNVEFFPGLGFATNEEFSQGL